MSPTAALIGFVIAIVGGVPTATRRVSLDHARVDRGELVGIMGSRTGLHSSLEKVTSARGCLCLHVE